MPSELLRDFPELKGKQTVMDVKIISDVLTAVTAGLGLIDKQGWRIGGTAGAAVIASVASFR